MKRLMKGSVLIAAIGLGVSSVVLADDEKANGVRNCTVATLDGLYVFAASGFIIPASGPAQPKARPCVFAPSTAILHECPHVRARYVCRAPRAALCSPAWPGPNPIPTSSSRS